MHQTKSVSEYIGSLLNSARMKHQVAYHHEFRTKPSVFADTSQPLPNSIQQALRKLGIKRLYSHQAQAINRIRRGQHVVVATPTASGKSLIYNIPVLERMIASPESKALYLFPLKALAQDQLKNLNALAALLPGRSVEAAVYDGDTSAWFRKKIRNAPPNVLISNPDMLHLSILPYHDKWASFLKNLTFVVVDEMHTYRGVMGSHMAHVFRRLIRLCSHYGASPVFIFSSATIANPDQLSSDLTGLPVQVLTSSGAPQGRRHVVLMDPDTSGSQTAIMLLKAALHRELRTIVYTQSRKMAELIAIWAGNSAGPYKDRISAYRAGFLPEERREIEARLSSGDLLAVISTSALELGIDIGDLDLCILIGYPGSIMATWQRSGRVGRSGQESALALVAGEDALDQYFIRHPKMFLKKEPEAAVVNPRNWRVLLQHLPCAAAEIPIHTNDPLIDAPSVKRALNHLVATGELLLDGVGDRYFAKLKQPHRHVDLRGSGTRYDIVCSITEQSRGEVDGFRAFKETHPGAIYLHRGDTHIVDRLDLEAETAYISPINVDYYTRYRGNKETEIIEVMETKAVRGTAVYFGRLKVTERVTGYEKRHIHTRKRINVIPLDLPPLIFETEGIWFSVAREFQQDAETAQLHFMGGIHAIEHAMIGGLPFYVMVDRNDLGGISIPFHPQIGQAAVFIYDGVPGGAGLSRQAFKKADGLLSHTRDLIRACDCSNGCPACVHSPKCGSGNRPIDKTAALFLLDKMNQEKAGITLPTVTLAAEPPEPLPEDDFSGRIRHFGVLDLETQRSAADVGGWHRADRMGISCVVLYDSEQDRYIEYLDSQMEALVEHLQHLDLIVGFNIKKFDYQVMSGYSRFEFGRLNTLDILEKVHHQLGYRLSLDALAGTTLGTEKTADGLQALAWWKEGKIRQIIDYCRSDVEITRDLYLFGQENGFLLFRNKADQIVRVPIDW